MGKFNEVKSAIVEKCGKAKNAITQYFQTKKETKATSRMQYLLHVYFDLKGIDLTKAEIQEVNDYLMKAVVVNQSSELDNLQKHVYQLSNINGGMEAFKRDREQVRAKLREGKIVTKTDACIATDMVIYDDHGIETFYYDSTEQKMRKHVVRPFNTFGVTINPDAKQPLGIVAYNEQMKKHIEKFYDVKSVAFPEHANNYKH